LIQPYVYNIDSTSSAFETRYIVTLASNPNAYVNSTFNVFGIDFNYWENGYVITSTSLGMNVLSMHDSSSLLDAGWATVNIDVDHDQLAIKVEDNDTEDRWEAIYKSDYIEFVNTPHDSWMHTGRFRAAITEEYISYEPIWDTLDEQWKFNLTQITSLELEAEDLGMDSTNVEIPPMHSHYVVDSTSAVKGEIYEIHFDPFILGVIATADCLEDGKITIQVFNFTGVTQEPDYFDIKLHRKTMKRSF
jgi:hypothetical protein